MHLTESCNDFHQLAAHSGNLFFRLEGGFLLKLFVLRRGAPLLLGQGGVVLDLLCIKCGKIHNGSSCGLCLFRKGDEILDMLSLQLQQFDLLLQRLFSVEGGIR